MNDDDTIGHLFASLSGREIPGGCDQCNAVQQMTEVGAGVWSLEIAHADGCPFLRAREAGAN